MKTYTIEVFFDKEGGSSSRERTSESFTINEVRIVISYLEQFKIGLVKELEKGQGVVDLLKQNKN